VHFPATLGRRQRLVAGVLGIGLGFGGPFLGSVGLVAATGDPTALILPLPFLGALWAIQGLAPSGYTLEDRGVRLERRWLRRLIPYDRITGCDRKPRPIGAGFCGPLRHAGTRAGLDSPARETGYTLRHEW